MAFNAAATSLRGLSAIGARTLGARTAGVLPHAQPLVWATSRFSSSVQSAAPKFDVNHGVFDHPILGPLAKKIQGPVKRGDDDEATPTSIAPMVPLLGGAGIMQSMNTPAIKWWMESCVGAGSIKMGLPGLAAQFLFIAPGQAVMKIMKDKDTGRLPLIPYSAMCCNGMIWATYGLLLENPAIWVPNVPAFVLGLAYTAVFVKNCPPEANWLPSTKGVHVAAVGAHIVGIPAMVAALEPAQCASILGGYGVVVCCVMFSGPMAALKQVFTDKSTESLPFAFTIATLVNCSLWTFYGSVINLDAYIWFPNLLGLGSGLAQLALFAKFGFGKPKKAAE